MRFGKLTVLSKSDQKKNGRTSWNCICDCGKTTVVRGNILTGGSTKSCGCARYEDLTGKRFGKLIVTGCSDEKRGSFRVWNCVCDCGNTTKATANSLKCGKVTSCGCVFREASSKAGKENFKKIIKPKCVDGTNLRNLTMSKSKANTSGFKGVSWSKKRKKWVASIMFKGKQYNLGGYEKIEDAVKARRDAEIEMFDKVLIQNNEEPTNETS